MAFLHSRNFQLIWAAWTLIMGLPLLLFYTIQNVHSFGEYLNAFIIFDFPNSWCPTFLILFGITALAAILISRPGINRVFSIISKFAGLGLLLIGITVLIGFTIEMPFAFNLNYIYPQLIHVTELLTGLFTVYILARPGK